MKPKLLNLVIGVEVALFVVVASLLLFHYVEASRLRTGLIVLASLLSACRTVFAEKLQARPHWRVILSTVPSLLLVGFLA